MHMPQLQIIIPRSIPITWPFTFSSVPFDWNLAKAEAAGRRVDVRENVEVARGSCSKMSVDADEVLGAKRETRESFLV